MKAGWGRSGGAENDMYISQDVTVHILTYKGIVPTVIESLIEKKFFLAFPLRLYFPPFQQTVGPHISPKDEDSLVV